MKETYMDRQESLKNMSENIYVVIKECTYLLLGKREDKKHRKGQRRSLKTYYVSHYKGR
jgi:hypothetical protein